MKSSGQDKYAIKNNLQHPRRVICSKTLRGSYTARPPGSLTQQDPPGVWRSIAIFGGTFNPVHLGHLVAAQTALETLKLNRVIFVPSSKPPHKLEKDLASAADRFKMVKLATENHPRFDVSDWEIKRGGKSYSIDTARFFRKKYPLPAQLFFIIGGDELIALPAWKDFEQLLELLTFVAVNRPGYKKSPESRRISHLAVEMPDIDLSSSLIRERVRAGQSVRFLVPDPVALYIEKKGLYR